jgi:hypothetical protein
MELLPEKAYDGQVERSKTVSAKPEPLGEKGKSQRVAWSIGAVAAAGLVLILSWNLIATRNELRQARGQLAALQTQVGQREGVIRLLSNPQVRIVNLADLPASRGAKGQLLWNPVSRTGLLLVTDLPQTPAGKTYELWGISGTESVPAGIFVVDTGGVALVRLPKLPETKAFDKFAVTIEPAGGAPPPTGAMVLLGNL